MLFHSNDVKTSLPFSACSLTNCSLYIVFLKHEGSGTTVPRIFNLTQTHQHNVSYIMNRWSLGAFEDRVPCQFEPKLIIKQNDPRCHENNNNQAANFSQNQSFFVIWLFMLRDSCSANLINRETTCSLTYVLQCFVPSEA